MGVGVVEQLQPMEVLQRGSVSVRSVGIVGQVEGQNGFDRPLPMLRGELRIDVLHEPGQFVLGGIVVQIGVSPTSPTRPIWR